jgi:hypothetical protein
VICDVAARHGCKRECFSGRHNRGCRCYPLELVKSTLSPIDHLRPYRMITHTMNAFRSSARVALQVRSSGLPRFVRGYASAPQYEHLLVSTPKPGVGFSRSTPLFSLHPICHNAFFVVILVPSSFNHTDTNFVQSSLIVQKPSMPSAHP